MKSSRPFSSIVVFAVVFASFKILPCDAKDSPLPPLAANAGRIIFYRDAISAAKNLPSLLLNGSDLGPIKSRSFFYVDRPPGNYTFAIEGEAAAPLSFTLAQAQQLYVRINVHSTPLSSELYPTLVDKTTGSREVATCKFAPPETVVPVADTRSPLRVLLTYKGHAFEEEKFFALWDSWQKQGLLTYTRCPLPDDAAQLEPSASDKYDVLVMYDMVLEIAPDQQQAFIALLQKGIGAVSLHHNLVAHEKWSRWREIIGGQFLRAAETIDGKNYEASVFEHDVWLKIGIADPKHSITRGIEPFYIFDESYGKIYHAPDIHVILTTDHTGNDREIAWTRWFGNSPVFYFQLGHDSHAWTHPLYQKILLQSLHWAAEEAAKRRSSASPEAMQIR